MWLFVIMFGRNPPARENVQVCACRSGLRDGELECLMPAKRILSAALALLLVAAIPARAASVPTLTVIDTINPGAGSSSAMDLYESVAFNGYLYFRAYDVTHGYELWRTNGTTTELVMDINTGTGGADNSYPLYFTALGDYLYFQANDGTHGYELWRTNGTTTTLVNDINSGTNWSYPVNFTALEGFLYFQANDGTHGYELWRTNGTTTTLVEDINTGTSGAESSSPNYFTAFDGYLYLWAYNATYGYELWRTNGTTTELVQDIRSGANSSSPAFFTALGDYLYFRATDGTHGFEIWRTDGTATERVPFPVAGQEIACSCYDTNIIAVGGRLYTTVYSEAIGHEFAYLDEPTYVLPETNRDGSVWTTTLVILASLTSAASIALRVRGAKRA